MVNCTLVPSISSEKPLKEIPSKVLHSSYFLISYH